MAEEDGPSSSAGDMDRSFSVAVHLSASRVARSGAFAKRSHVLARSKPWRLYRGTSAAIPGISMVLLAALSLVDLMQPMPSGGTSRLDGNSLLQQSRQLIP